MSRKVANELMAGSKKGRKSKPLTESELQLKDLSEQMTDIKLKKEHKTLLTDIEKNTEQEFKLLKVKVQSEKFHELATFRLKKIVKAIEQMGYLSNKSSYNYRDDQIDVIITTLHSAVDNLNAKFKPEIVSKEGIIIPA